MACSNTNTSPQDVVEALAASSKYLATGSTDEHVKIYDLRIRKEVGTLMHHSGTITALEFFRNTHLITASEDGTIGIVRSSDWELLKTLKGHTASVLSISIHPSGKILLSVSKDKTLRCWDLMRGVCAYTLKLHAIAERVVWSATGSHYALLFSNTVIVYLVESGEATGKFESPRSRLNSITFTTCHSTNSHLDDVVIIGGEDKRITVASTTGEIIMQWNSGHKSRIKDIASLMSTKREASVFATCSSDGAIFLWDLQVCQHAFLGWKYDDAIKPDVQPSPEKIAEYDAKCRLTCLALAEVEAKSEINKQLASTFDTPESDYEDVGIERPTIVVTIEDEGRKRKNMDSVLPTPVARKQHKVKKSLKSRSKRDSAVVSKISAASFESLK
ncbi:hypothetical protein BASA81_008195 [Batrachochytrium salamandrivorans]|nr:hypothetical protein BASA81_008195 [Batrachochytrium salamandrivorans]